MANIIRRSEIAEEDIFKDIRDSAEKTEIGLRSMNEEIQKTAKSFEKGIKGAQFTDTASINKFTESAKKVNALKEQSLKIDKEIAKASKIKNDAEASLERIKREKLKTEREELKNKQALTREADRLERVQKRSLKTLENERNEYKKLVIETRNFKNESKRLAANLIKLEQAGRRNSKEFRDLSAEYREVTRAARQGDSALKKIDSTVGDNFRNVGNYTQAVGKLKNVLGQLGLAFGAFEILRSAGTTITEFNAQVQDLVSITGASGKDLEFFKEQAIDLGTEVKGGASGVVEAFKLIGSAKPELLENAQALNSVTEAAIKLSQASGLELPDAATRLTDAMNQFGADADQAAHFIDVLANGALFGAAEIPQVTDAMLKFGAVAKQSNVSIQESTALIEALASKGLKGAEAGTALRNVMLKLSAPDALPKEAQERLSALGISFEKLNDSSVPFSERLKELKPLLKDSAALQKTFGAENAVAATNLIEMTDVVEDLTEKMDKQGTASEQAQERTNTLAFAFNKLKEEWNKLVLEFTEGSGATSFLKDTLFFLANNLSTILSMIGKAVVAWGVYKASILATRSAHFVLSGGIKDTLKGMVQQVRGLRNVGKASKSAGTAIRGAGNAMKAIPWVAIIAFALEFAQAMFDVATGANEAKEAQMKLEAFQETASKQQQERTKVRQDALRKELTANEQAFRKKEIQEEKLKALNEEAIKDAIKEVESDIKTTQARVDRRRKSEEELVKLVRKGRNGMITVTTETTKVLEKALEKSGRSLEEFKTNFGNSFDASEVRAFTATLTAQVEAGEEKIKGYNDELNGLNEELAEAKTQTFEAANNQNEFNKSTSVTPRNLKKISTEFRDVIDRNKEYNSELRESIKLQKDINQLGFDAEVSSTEDQINAELQSQRRAAETTGEIQVDKLEELIDKKASIQRQAINEQTEFEKNAAKKAFEDRFSDLENELEKERQRLLSQKGLTEQQILEIEEGFQREKADLDAVKVEAQRNLDLEIERIHRESAEELKEIDREVAQEKENLNDELIQEQINFSDKQAEALQDSNNNLLKSEQDAAQRRKEIAQLTTDFLIKKSQERIDQAEKEIKNAEDKQNFLEQLAANGNIKAQESIAEQNRIIAEAEKKKALEQRRQQRIQLINAGLQTYNSKVQAGSENPFAETLRDITLLQQFLSAIPAFYEGTDTTVQAALGSPDLAGRDGYVVRVDGQEKILNPELSKMTGSLTTNQIASISQDYLNGKLVNGGSVALIGQEGEIHSEKIVKKLDSLERTIRNKTETNYNFDQFTDKVFGILKTEKKGNTIIYNKYRKDL